MGCIAKSPDGVPACMGAAARGDDYCTCRPSLRQRRGLRVAYLEASIASLEASLSKLTDALIDRGIIPEFRP